MVGSAEWFISRYNITTKLPIDNYGADCKRIFCCAYREYDKSKGATGGPGGVLHLQEELVNGEIKGIPLQYIFRDSDYRVPDHIWKEMGTLNFNMQIRSVIAGAGYILTDESVLSALNNNENPIFICHDLGTAYGACLLGCKYVLIYHQQGSLLQEINSFSKQCSEEEILILSSIENIVFTNASKVYFPSNGAKKLFLDTSPTKFNSCIIKQILSEEPLYNTIEKKEYTGNIQEVFQKYDINIPDNYEIFLSIGDYIWAKGVDRVPDFLSLYRQVNTNFIWILAGNAGNKEIFEKIQMKCLENKIQCKLLQKRIPHGDLMTLIDRSDYYIMMHRSSVFDLATLEAMRAGKKILLSDCASNQEFNLADNIVIIPDEMNEAIGKMTQKDGKGWEAANKDVYEKYFSNISFKGRYEKMIESVIRTNG